MIYYNDHFYSEFEEILEERLEDGVEITEDNAIIEYQDCDLEPVFVFDVHRIVEIFTEERDDEDGNQYDKIVELLKKHCDSERINMCMPKLWYPSGPWLQFDLRQLIDKEVDNG